MFLPEMHRIAAFSMSDKQDARLKLDLENTLPIVEIKS
jgi:hypothetical protein